MYCILRTKKVKSKLNITQAFEHNLRLRPQGNIDAKKTHKNQILHNPLKIDLTDAKSMQLKLTEYYKKLEIKERPDNVLMMEFVVSASPQFFENSNNKKIDSWAQSQLEFMKKEYGEQLQFAVLHLDEKTPHLHFHISTEHKTIKRYKNQKGECFREKYSLNAKRYNPEYLRGLQDRFGAHNAVFGLTRGKATSNKAHVPLKDYYKEINLEFEAIEKLKNTAQKWNDFKKFYPKLKQNILKQFEIIELLTGILETKKLTDIEKELVQSVKKDKKLTSGLNHSP